jgi:SAM-dependent methyltransferase
MSKNPGRDFRYKQILERVSSVRDSNARLIDVGCGTGQLLKTIGARFETFELIGLDVSRTALDEASHAVPQAEFHQILITEIEQAPRLVSKIGKAKIVVCSEVLEHVDFPEVTLDWILKEILEPQGTLIITVPSGPMSFFDKFIGHRRHYTSRTLNDLLVNSGFTGVTISRSGFPGINLMRVAAILRGKRIIQDISDYQEIGFVQSIGLKVATFLMKFSANDSILGWQLIATASFMDLKE